MRREIAAAMLWLVPAPALAADDGGAQPQAALVFRWEKLPGAASYVIEIAGDKTFDRIALKETVRENYYRWETPGQQAYFWRVRGIDADGREGKSSEIRFVGKIVTPPKLLSPTAGEEITARPDPVMLRWQRSDFLRTYVVQTAPDAAFSAPVSHEVTRTQYAFAPPQAGQWYWRVGGVDLNGDPVSPGESRSFALIAPVQRRRAITVGLAPGIFVDDHRQAELGARADLAWELGGGFSAVLEPGAYRGLAAKQPSGLLNTVPVDALLRWTLPRARWGLELGLGPAMSARMDHAGNEAIGAGARGEIGVYVPIRRGQLFASAGGRWITQGALLPGSGATASAGWRIEVW